MQDMHSIFWSLLTSSDLDLDLDLDLALTLELKTGTNWLLLPWGTFDRLWVFLLLVVFEFPHRTDGQTDGRTKPVMRLVRMAA